VMVREPFQGISKMSRQNTILRKDTLIVPDGVTYIIYSQFSNLITRIKKFPKKETPAEEELKKKGFFQSLPKSIGKDEEWKGFNSLTLLINRKCNLKCIYCYASPGVDGPSMSTDLALDAINWFLKHRIDNSRIRITFHAGGEPTLEQNLIRKVVSEIEKKKSNSKVRYLIVTNGTSNKNFLKWMMNKNFAISFSVDGPPDIQDRNRPFADGSASSGVVEDNIKYLVFNGRPPGIRLTYSSKDDIVRIIRYFGDLGIKNLHLEPLFPYGREYNIVKFGENSGYDVFSPETRDLINGFFQAMEVCKKYKMRIYNGHIAHFSKGIGYFCGAASGRSMLVTHDGLLTGCLEVVDSEDKDIELFKVGQWISEKREFDLDMEKISLFQKRHADFLLTCKDCFARYTCAGGCAVKAVRSSQGFLGRDISYCGFTRSFIPILVKKIAKINKI